MTELPDSLFSNQPAPIVENASGAIDYSNDEAKEGRSMIAADSSNYEQRTSFKVCGLEEVDILIGDKPPEPALYEALITSNVGIL